MNEPTIDPPNSTTAAACCNEVDQCVRRNPGTAVLVAIGTGLMIGLLIRALRPEPTPQRRVMNLLEDLEDRLRDAATPLVRKAGLMASNGADVLRGGAQDGEKWAARLLREANRRARKLVG